MRATCPAHLILLDLPNNIWGGVQNMELLIVKLPPFSCYLIALRSKYKLLLQNLKKGTVYTVVVVRSVSLPIHFTANLHFSVLIIKQLTQPRRDYSFRFRQLSVLFSGRIY
jgi:hypothetical protein